MAVSGGGIKNITIDTRPFTLVTEGKAEVNFPSSLDVFYNPVQEFNRDMSIAVLRQFSHDYSIIKAQKEVSKRKKLVEEDFQLEGHHLELSNLKNDNFPGIRILEALAASGLRSIRYAKEIEGISEIVANDYSESAINCMIQNLNLNDVKHIIKPSHNDASLLMMQNRKYPDRFHAVDLDPYGSPHNFLDGAVQCVADGGLLLVTSTDMAVLCGNCPETCYTKYGSLSIKIRAHHEMALRILLQCIEANANKYGRYIVPLLSLSVDFYVRVFVRVFTSQEKCKETFTKLAYVHSCNGCQSVTLQRLGKIIQNGNSKKYKLNSPAVDKNCSHCSHSHSTGGPIWAAPIHDVKFVTRLKNSLVEKDFNTYNRMHGMLSMVEEELPEHPFFIVLDKTSAILKMSTIKKADFASALLNAGFKVSQTHACSRALKTDASQHVIWDILRHKDREDPIDREKLSLVARNILEKDIQTKISFERHPKAEFESLKNVLRFQINPEKDWGPKTKSKTSIFHGHLKEKSKSNQGKRKGYLNEDSKKKVAYESQDNLLNSKET